MLTLYLAETLLRLYRSAKTTLSTLKILFDSLNASKDRELVAKWEKETVKATKDAMGEWESVFKLNTKWEQGAF